MKGTIRKLLAACVPALFLAACGGGDPLNVSDPMIRLVHASPVAPALTLSRETDGRVFIADAPYPHASDYITIEPEAAEWTVQYAADGAVVDSVLIDADRGARYSVIVAADSALTSSVFMIVDPFDKPPASDSTRLRLFHGSAAMVAVDVYVNAAGTDIADPALQPLIAGVAYQAAGPQSGQDAVDLPAGDYQVTLAAAGTKSVLFAGRLSFGADRDVLLVVVPIIGVPGGSQLLVKIDGDAGMTEVPPCDFGTPIPLCA